MTIKDYVEKAKTGDKKAFDWLVKHFEPIFCNDVVRFNNNDETLRDEAKKKLPEIIRRHIDNNYDSKLDNYLRARAHIEFRDKNKLSDTRVLERDSLISTYSKRFLKHIFKYKNILTEEELEQYSVNYITKLVDTYIDDRDSFSNNINSRMSFETKYLQNEEVFLIRYVVQEGSNDKIVSSFYNKYMYLLDDYKTKNSYFMLKACFKSIVEDVLNGITSHVSNIKPYLKQGIHRMHVDIISSLKEEEKLVRIDEASKLLLYYSYYSITEFMFEKYKDMINMQSSDFRKLLKEKYDLYFIGYINGNSNGDLRKRIINSFNNYFKWVLNNNIINFVDEDETKNKVGEKNANKRVNRKC